MKEKNEQKFKNFSCLFKKRISVFFLIALTVLILTSCSCGGETGGMIEKGTSVVPEPELGPRTEFKPDLEPDERELDVNLSSNVSAAGCADSVMDLDCFISVWNTENIDLLGASEDNQVKLPLVVNGEYNFFVDWGDGSEVQHITAFNAIEATHTYAVSGEYTVYIAGTIAGWKFYVSGFNYGDASKLLDVTQWGALSLGNTLGHQFDNARNFNPSAVDSPNLYETVDLSYAFKSASNFNGAIGNWGMGNVTNMRYMFRTAPAFNQDINSWNVGNVGDTSFMFYGAKDFNQSLNAWKVGRVTNMSYMFHDASTFNQDISSWNVEGVTNMAYTFAFAEDFNKPLNSWDVSNVNDMRAMFHGATAFNQDLSGWNVENVANMLFMFNSAIVFNQNINNWDVGNVKNMEFMFYNAATFNQPLEAWNIKKTTNVSFMFRSASSFNQPLNTWNMSNVISTRQMFYQAFDFNQDLSSWDVSRVIDMGAMFNYASIFNQNLTAWDVSSVRNYLSFAQSSMLSIENYPRFQ